jgi:hypothetical protein
VALGVITLASVTMLLVKDGAPQFFPTGSHDTLAAFSLATIAVAYVIFQIVQRAALAEMGKAILLAAAFLFWAANQFWPNLPQAALFNDIAIGLFVLDVFLVILGWPPAANRSFFGEGGWTSAGRHAMNCGCCDCGEWTGDGPRKSVNATADEPETAVRVGAAGRRFE